MAKLKRIYEVLHEAGGPYSGAAGDGTHIARFSKEAEALAFAKGRIVYGKPVAVGMVEVSARLAARWGF